MEVIMKKRILCRALTGAPIGLAISTVITIFYSLIYGDGNYYPVVPALVEQCGNEINAVVAQMIASGKSSVFSSHFSQIRRGACCGRQ
jgi:hypothetical protein